MSNGGYVWHEPGQRVAVPVTVVEWLLGGARALIETLGGARVNVPVEQLEWVEA